MNGSQQTIDRQALGKCKLVSLRIANNALGADALPSRLKLLNWGRNPSTKGDIYVNATTLASLHANQSRLGFDKVALDWEHNTVPGSPEFERTREPRSVAAFGVPEVVSGDGLYLNNLTWTPDGQASAKNFPDLSPCVLMDESGTVTFLHSSALTRTGSVEGLEFLSALSSLSSLLSLTSLPSNPNQKPNHKMTDQEIQAAIANALAPLNQSLTALTAKVDAIKPADLTPLSARLDRFETAEKSKIVADFAAQGKTPKNAKGEVLKADDLLKLSVDELQLLHANSPANIVPLSARTGNPAIAPSTPEADANAARKRRAHELVASGQARNFDAAWEMASNKS